MTKRKRIELNLTAESEKILKELQDSITTPSRAQIAGRAFDFVKRARESGEPALEQLDFGESTPQRQDQPVLQVSSVVVPKEKKSEGTLIKAHALAWSTILDKLGKDWSTAYNIPHNLWEEIIAATFDKAGFDEVILTPRTGDHGRDVIATMRGAGSIKMLSSVKAYSPNHLVSYDDIRAVLGVLSGERDASKGIITTTSGFPPKVLDDPFIKPFLPTRLELVGGDELYDWIMAMANRRH